MKKFICIRAYSFNDGSPIAFENLGTITAESYDKALDNEIFMQPHTRQFADFNFWAIEVPVEPVMLALIDEMAKQDSTPMIMIGLKSNQDMSMVFLPTLDIYDVEQILSDALDAI